MLLYGCNLLTAQKNDIKRTVVGSGRVAFQTMLLNTVDTTAFGNQTQQLLEVFTIRDELLSQCRRVWSHSLQQQKQSSKLDVGRSIPH